MYTLTNTLAHTITYTRTRAQAHVDDTNQVDPDVHGDVADGGGEGKADAGGHPTRRNRK